MMKTCKGKDSCGRTLDESLMALYKGKISNKCKECKNARSHFYRWRYRPERIDNAQLARDMCQKLIDEKENNGK